MNNRLIRVLVASVVGLVLAGGIAWWQIRHVPDAAISGKATIGGPFQLVDHTGRTVTDADFRGKYLLIYFGYTFCPDVCPTELQTMAQALDRLGPEAERVQPLFVTVDPERDTAAHLADYVGLFHPRLVGLTGTVAQTSAVARAYHVYYAKAKADDPKYYLMDHSSFVYLMGPDGSFVTVFPAGTQPGTMAEAIRAKLKT